MDLVDLLRLGDTVSTVGVCLAGLAAFIRGWVVPGSTANRLIKERDEWQQIAMEAMRLGTRAVGVAQNDPEHGGSQ